MGKKINSELKIDSDYFNIKLGTTDKKNPSVVYIDCGCYIEPTASKESIQDNIHLLEEELKSKIDGIFFLRTFKEKNDAIYIFETAEDRLEVGKKSYLSIQLFWKPSNIGAYPKFTDYKNWVEMGHFHKENMEFFKRVFEKNHFNVYKTKR